MSIQKQILSLLKEKISQNINRQFNKILIEKLNNIGIITMNSSKDLNCLSSVMLQQLSQALMLHDQDSDINVIIIRSSHKSIFCAGADIKEFMKHDYEFYIRHDIFNILENAFLKTKKPVIAAVNGKALGGGFQLALIADIIIGSDKSYFALPELTLGLMPGMGGTQRLAKIIGEKLAMRYILSSKEIDGRKAADLGIIQLANSQNFDENVQKIAYSIASKAQSTLIVTKKAIKQATDTLITQGLQFEKSTFYPLMVTKAAHEGIAAFMEKRKPNFKNM